MNNEDEILNPEPRVVTNFELTAVFAVDDYKFRWKWSYLFKWKRAYRRWEFCRDMTITINRLADDMKRNIDEEILEAIKGKSNESTTEPN